MINLTKNFQVKAAEKLLSDIELYKSSIEFYKGLLECDSLPEDKYKKALEKLKYLNHMVNSVEHAIELLTDTEREIIKKLYFHKELSFYDICEDCSLERSSVYRHRTNALKKISKAIYGVDDEIAE